MDLTQLLNGFQAPKIFVKQRKIVQNKSPKKVLPLVSTLQLRPVGAVDVPPLPKIHEIGRFWSTHDLDERAIERLTVTSEFYTDEHLTSYLLPLINQEAKVSLRALDWLVTNFAKKQKIVYLWPILPDPEQQVINIYNEYRSWLKCFRRKLYDPFRRVDNKRKRHSIYFYYGTFEENPLLYMTTVAQLNFLSWAWTYGVYAYAVRNIDLIVLDMKKCVSSHKKIIDHEVDFEPLLQTRGKRRRELSKAPSAKCFVYKITGKVCFSDEEPSEDEDEDTEEDINIKEEPIQQEAVMMTIKKEPKEVVNALCCFDLPY